MFIVMTGEGWVEIADTAAHYVNGVEVVFILYYTITAIALVNLVTGWEINDTKSDQIRAREPGFFLPDLATFLNIFSCNFRQHSLNSRN